MASCPANSRETKIGFGFTPQADLVTRNPDPELWSVTKTNSTAGTVELTTEDDADDIGKGDEFPANNYPQSASTTVPIEKYVSSEFAAWLFCFATGKASKTGVAPAAVTYAAVPSDPAVECINIPAFTWAQQIRQPPDAVVDDCYVGVVVNEFTLSLDSGPGRNNCRVVVGCIGTGQVLPPPTGVVIPALTAEHMLNATAATKMTVNGIDYLLGGNFISAEFRWMNNLRTDSGYYPGSGSQNGYAIRGRMEYNKRQMTLSYRARAQKGSQELQNLLSQAEGPTQITIGGAQIGAGPETHSIDLLFPRTVQASYTTGDADGLVTVEGTIKIMTPKTGGVPICTLSSTTTMDGIFGL